VLLLLLRRSHRGALTPSSSSSEIGLSFVLVAARSLRLRQRIRMPRHHRWTWGVVMMYQIELGLQLHAGVPIHLARDV